MKIKNLKFILTAFTLAASIITSKGQCNVKTIHRPDGVTMRYLNPVLVGTGTQCELGGSIYFNGEEYTLATTVRYSGKPKKTIGTLMIQLSNDVSLVLKMHDNQLATVKNEEVSLSVFYLTKSDVANLKKAYIKTIVFKEEGGKNQIITVSDNKYFAATQIKCLEQ